MASRNRLVASAASSLLQASWPLATSRVAAATLTPALRRFSQLNSSANSSPASLFSIGQGNSQAGPPAYFSSKKRLPTNTVVRFVPQQTAWIVERMGKFNRILEPGLAVLIPFIDRIAYVRSLKENAIEIPSQSAITADNVTLELDGVLYTRVFDAYKARYARQNTILGELRLTIAATASRMPSTPFRSSPKQRCDPRSASSRSITS
jgi:hypothetical protein